MAFTSEIHGTHASITARIAVTFKSVVQRASNYRMYRKTVNELSVLTSRELDDLGINRSMIKRVALEAAYDL